MVSLSANLPSRARRSSLVELEEGSGAELGPLLCLTFEVSRRGPHSALLAACRRCGDASTFSGQTSRLPSILERTLSFFILRSTSTLRITALELELLFNPHHNLPRAHESSAYNTVLTHDASRL